MTNPALGYRGMSPVLSFSLTLALAIGSATSAHATLKVSTKTTQNMNCSGGVCTATAADAVLNVGDLANMLAGSDRRQDQAGRGARDRLLPRADRRGLTALPPGKGREFGPNTAFAR